MVTLSTRTERTGGVTLVGCRLANDGDEPRVAVVESRLDGESRVPAANRSDEGTLRVTVPAGATVGAGFATPAPPEEDAPAELVAARLAAGPTAGAVVAELSDPRPPRAALVGDEPATDEDDDDPLDTLDAAERRIERLATVAAATSVPEAAAALESAGGLDAVRELDAAVRADRDRLLALADRAERLAARAEAADPRLDALERLS